MTIFKKATREQSKARIGLIGPAGSGKTYTSLIIATALGNRVAVVDTEHGSASKYADIFNFDVVNLDSFSPKNYIDAIKAAESEKYDCLILDSISHAWAGKDGILEQVDNIKQKSHSGNAFTTGWREMTPEHNRFIDTMLASNLHLIATMRSKTDWIIEENEKGQKAPKKIGMAPVQREGMDYEFDICGDLDWNNNLSITKSRCSIINKGFYKTPDKEFAKLIKDWLETGEPFATQVEIEALRKLASAKKSLLSPEQTKSLATVFTSAMTKSICDEWSQVLNQLKEVK